MTIRELVTKFGFDIDDGKLDELDKSVDQLKTGLAGLTVMAASATVALFGVVRMSANAASNITNTASSIGVSTEALQRLGYAAQLSGANIDTMGVGLRVLSKNIAEAAKDRFSDLSKEFHKLGINVVQANGRLKTADQVFLELSDRFTHIQDPAKRVSTAMTLLGKSGSQLIQTLERGRPGIQAFADELDRAGAGLLDEDALARLGAFNDAWDRFFGLISGLRNAVSAEIAPVLTGIIDKLRQWLVINGKVVKSQLLGFMRALVWYFKGVLAVGLRVGDMFASMAKAIGGAEVAMKVFLVALTTLAAGSTVLGIMGVVKALWAIAPAVWTAMAPLAGLAAAIIASAAVIFLVLEDIYSYFTGGDSVTGYFVSQWSEAWKWIKHGFTEGVEFLRSKLQGFADWFQGFVKPFTEFFGKFGAGLNKFMGGSSFPSVGASASAGAARMFGLSPSTAPVGGASSNSNVNVNAPITVTVPPGTDPAVVPDRVETGLFDGISSTLRTTGRAMSPAVKY